MALEQAEGRQSGGIINHHEALKFNLNTEGCSTLSTKKFGTSKVVLVTGGAGGIGTAIAKRFAQEGANVWVADIDGDAAERTATAIAGLAAGIPRAIKVDVTQEREVQQMIYEIEGRDGGLDVLVNNAVSYVLKSAGDATAEDWDKSLSTNVKGYALCTKYALQLMEKKRDGNRTLNSECAIVNLGSISSHIAQPGLCTYSTSKAAILGLTRCTAMDSGQYGIRCNAVCPGPIMTEATQKHAKSQKQSVDKLIQQAVGQSIIQRMGVTDEVASAVAFLASSEASFITGASLNVDGGYCAV